MYALGVASRSVPICYVHIVSRVCPNLRNLLSVPDVCAGIKAKWIGDSQRAVERGEALARAELERQLDIQRQVESPTEIKQELASTTEKTV